LKAEVNKFKGFDKGLIYLLTQFGSAGLEPPELGGPASVAILSAATKKLYHFSPDQ